MYKRQLLQREKKEPRAAPLTLRRIIIMGNKLSSTAKRKKEEAMIAEAAADMERLKLGPTAIWTGLVLHHKDVFVSHVLSKLNEMDRCFFSEVSRESQDVLKYAGVNLSELRIPVWECSSISTLEWVWNNMAWGEKSKSGSVIDQAWFCKELAFSNKLELLKWVREEKKCEWDEWTIRVVVYTCNFELLKYCFANDFPCNDEKSCVQAVIGGHLDCL